MTSPATRWQRLAADDAGPSYAEAYAQRFVDAEAAGDDVHGEATFLAGLVPAPARVLDAGCGTGRVAVRLAELGYDVVGVDADAAMLDVARRDAPGLDWRVLDLAALADLAGSPRDLTGFDLVVLAGNVVPLCEPGTLDAVAGGCARAVRDGGVVVSGFGLDAEHLPDGCPPVPLVTWDDACAAAGLRLADRFAGWDCASAGAGLDGYAVSVHRREVTR